LLVEVTTELREVAPASGGNHTHDVIGQERHQHGQDRQLRALLVEVVRFNDIDSIWRDNDDP
jgi:hypothetical protein